MKIVVNGGRNWIDFWKVNLCHSTNVEWFLELQSVALHTEKAVWQSYQVQVL